jgi:hypothetical protein
MLGLVELLGLHCRRESFLKDISCDKAFGGGWKSSGDVSNHAVGVVKPWL